MKTDPATAAPEHKPYVSADQVIPEFGLAPIVVGAILGIIFGASSLYLVLQVGMTVSASIPIAVLSITLFRLFPRIPPFRWFIHRDATILENNMVQTTGSAGESIAFGVGVTMPALLILGYNLEITRVMLVAVLGGLLGVLMMIPLRRVFIVKQHGKLIYPEGVACADVLMVGEKGGASAATVFGGFGLGFVYQFLMQAFKFWPDEPTGPMHWGRFQFKGAHIALEAKPALLGVGYVIGPRISCIMVAGGILASWVLSPAIVLFGQGLATPLYPAEKPISAMSLDEIWHDYVLYIGAGAVAAGGIISMMQSLPTIVGSIRAGLSDLASRGNNSSAQRRFTVSRLDRDMSMKVVLFGCLALILAISLAPMLNMNPLGAVLIIFFGFLFVTVSARLTGEIGSSSNPISGMTVATLLLTCLIFVAVGWTGEFYRLTALSIAGIVCIACSNGGTVAQCLKTGFIVGATPRSQQIGILVGALTSALVIGWTLLVLNDTATVYTKKDLPQTTIDVAQLGPPEQVRGPYSEGDTTDYGVLQAQETQFPGVPAGKYLVDELGVIRYGVAPGAESGSPRYIRTNFTRVTVDTSLLGSKEKVGTPYFEGDTKGYGVLQARAGQIAGIPAGKYLVDGSGEIQYLVDPGINGRLKENDDGTRVEKFNAPKAALMSFIVDGILTQKLPWSLVLLGVAISIVLELSGVPSLPFAVGVYLPLSASTPIFCGGMLRWLGDKLSRRSAAESEMSPGVLLSSGYIAGGTIAGIVAALLAIKYKALADVGPKQLGELANGNWTTVVAFGALAATLLWVSTRGNSVEAKS
jgi:putative OPT family oligopeptide transporter